MISFQTLTDLNNYVPTCVICHKTMNISCDIIIASPTKKKWASGRDKQHVRFAIEYNTLRSLHKSTVLTLNMGTNEFLEGADIISRLTSEFVFVKKTCPTCDFKIETSCESRIIKKEKRIPALTLVNEELHFTMRGGKDLRIIKNYKWYPDMADNHLAEIHLNSKKLPSIVPIDFNKFSGFEHLNKRLATIITFH